MSTKVSVGFRRRCRGPAPDIAPPFPRATPALPFHCSTTSSFGRAKQPRCIQHSTPHSAISPILQSCLRAPRSKNSPSYGDFIDHQRVIFSSLCVWRWMKCPPHRQVLVAARGEYVELCRFPYRTIQPELQRFRQAVCLMPSPTERYGCYP